MLRHSLPCTFECEKPQRVSNASERQTLSPIDQLQPDAIVAFICSLLTILLIVNRVGAELVVVVGEVLHIQEAYDHNRYLGSILTYNRIIEIRIELCPHICMHALTVSVLSIT